MMDTEQQPAQDSPGVTFIPPIPYLLCLITGGAVEYFIPSDFPLPRSARLALGLTLGAAGFWFMAWGRGMFHKQRTSEKTFKPATALVVVGAYQYSRNPMYVGMTGLLLGIGLAAGSLWLLLAGLPFCVFIMRYVVPREEAYMHRRWGEAYLDYCRRVRRWL